MTMASDWAPSRSILPLLPVFSPASTSPFVLKSTSIQLSPPSSRLTVIFQMRSAVYSHRTWPAVSGMAGGHFSGSSVELLSGLVVAV